VSDRNGDDEQRLKEIEGELRLRKDILLEIQSAQFGHAAHYAAVIVFGGYAALFTVWSLTKQFMDARASFWTGMLIGISVLLFVSFEIFKTFASAGVRTKQTALLNTASTAAELEEGIKRIRREANEFNSMVLIPIWLPIFILTVVTGVGAAGILIYHFASALVSGRV
jgi:hypothetical protein